MRHHTMLRLSVLLIVLAATSAFAGRCMQLPGMPGYTVPSGDISVEYGKPLEILCVLDPEHSATAGTNASDIVFEQNDSPVPSEYVQVVNSTAARLYIEHAEPVNSSYYYCVLKPSGRKPTPVCVNHVAVGYAPRDLKIEKFTCVSRHLKNLNCTWEVPYNPIKTTYSISYTFGLPATRHLNRFQCPDEFSPNFGYCYWDDNTHPMYREKDEVYYFKIHAENVLGSHTFDEIEFNQWAHALLDRPEFLNGSEITTNSVYLHWQIDPNLRPVPLKYKLLYKSETSECDMTDEWKEVDTSDFKWKTSSFNLADLPYANFLYDVRLYIAPAKAEGDHVWSEPATFTFRTQPMPPASPPELAPGSFQVIGKESTRDVLIFWKRLPRCQENGDDFRYKVVAREVGTSKPELEDPQPKSSYARFSNLSLNAYEVSVYAVNREGASKPAVIRIPDKRLTPPQASRIATVVKENGVVQLTWDGAFPQEWADKADSVTVFWCQNEQLSSVHCTGLLNSTVVGRGKAEATIQTRPGKVYEFGVSVNAGPDSSGISWVTCTLRPDSVFGRVPVPTVLNLGDTFLEISFKVDCLNGLKSAHYQVQYCPIDGPKRPECREPLETLPVTTSGTDVLVKVSGLRPYTTYRVSVVRTTPAGEQLGDRSEWLDATTLEAPPSPPRDLAVEKAATDSAVVSWQPPRYYNGKLRAYLLSYGDREVRVRPEEGTRARLAGLEAGSVYVVRVSACTNKGCTPAEEPAVVRTPAAPPGATRLVGARPLPGGRLALAWEPPRPAGAPRHRYQLLLADEQGRTNWTRALLPAAADNLTADVDVPVCKGDPDASYRVAVRALNLDEANNTLPGPWTWTESYCSVTRGLQKGRVLLWCVGTLLALGACGALLVGARRLARWWRLARGVQVKLPPGLAPPAADKRDRDEERRVRHPWLLYGGERALAGAHRPPESPTHEEATLLRGGGGGGGGGSTATGSDCALSSLTSATTAASDSDDAAEPECGSGGGRPRAARQWSTFSDGSVSRSTPNLWEAEAQPYCRAGLGGAPAYVAVASAPYVRRGSLDGWPHTVAAVAAVPAGYTQMGANNQLVSAAELKAPLAVHNHSHDETGRGYVPRPVEAAPPVGKQPLVLAPLTQWPPSNNNNNNNNNTVPYVTAARPPLSTPQQVTYQQPQHAPSVWPSIRCEMPAAASPAPAARGYVSVDQLPPPAAAPGASPPPAGYAVCSSGRPPDGAPPVTSPAQSPMHHCKPGGPYVLLGEAATGSGPPSSPARGYVSLQQLERT